MQHNTRIHAKKVTQHWNTNHQFPPQLCQVCLCYVRPIEHEPDLFGRQSDHPE